MKKKNYKGRVEKRQATKCADVCRTYNSIQSAYVDVLEDREDIIEFKCNVPCLEEGEYTTDFVCSKQDGSLMVRECVTRNLLTRPLTMKLLQLSYEWWSRRGAEWGLVVDAVTKE